MGAVGESITEPVSSQNATGMDHNAITKNCTRVQDYTRIELAVSTDLTTGHQRYTPMQMATRSNDAICIDGDEGIDD